MANYCSNQLTVTGADPDLRAFREHARGDQGPFDINRFIPMPQAIRQTEAPNPDAEQAQALRATYGAADWHEWARQNWGTKWGAADTTSQWQSPDTLVYQFTTAWTPFSEQVIAAISEQHPSLEFHLEYEEPDCAFHGSCTAANGQILSSETASIVTDA